MLLNLKVEICKKDISSAKIAKYLGIDVGTMSKKVTEKNQFTRAEMYKIHDKFFPDVDFHYLFQSDKEYKVQKGI